MTKRNYIRIAALLRKQIVNAPSIRDSLIEGVNEFADIFESENPAFVRERFLAAAIPPDTTSFDCPSTI